VPDAEERKDEPAGLPPPEDKVVETTHSVVVAGETIDYTATCGTIVIRQEREKKGEQEGEFEGERAHATMFFVAYTRSGVADPSTRPITYSFNGGPGSSSVWLHLGALGPRRVEMGDVGALRPPPFGLVDNEHSLLDVSDLVFIDPVGTGYSRPVAGEKAKDFHTLDKDIESVGEFIRLYTSRYGRWRSPKFLIGESYGTTRAAGLAPHLHERHGMAMNGIMLVSVVLDFATIVFGAGNDLPYILFLPGYTAAAWYHGRLEPELQSGGVEAAVRESEAFARGDYALALLQGDRLPEAERREIARRVARFSGLDPEFVERADLRVSDQRFFKELLRREGKTIGRLDSRFTGADRDHVGETPEFDPSLSVIVGPYANAVNDYVRRELGYESDLPYEVLSLKVNEQWAFERDNDYVRMTESLRKAITANPSLRVLVASGLFDLGTPPAATDYTIDHLGLPEGLRGNLTVHTYEAGHMMYVHPPSLEKLKRDLASFVRSAVP
jgi:carboxypeptidase C (cathepsin A)